MQPYFIVHANILIWSPDLKYEERKLIGNPAASLLLSPLTSLALQHTKDCQSVKIWNIPSFFFRYYSFLPVQLIGPFASVENRPSFLCLYDWLKNRGQYKTQFPFACYNVM